MAHPLLGRASGGAYPPTLKWLSLSAKWLRLSVLKWLWLSSEVAVTCTLSCDLHALSVVHTRKPSRRSGVPVTMAAPWQLSPWQQHGNRFCHHDRMSWAGCGETLTWHGVVTEDSFVHLRRDTNEIRLTQGILHLMSRPVYARVFFPPKEFGKHRIDIGWIQVSIYYLG